MGGAVKLGAATLTLLSCVVIGGVLLDTGNQDNAADTEDAGNSATTVTLGGATQGQPTNDAVTPT